MSGLNAPYRCTASLFFTDRPDMVAILGADGQPRTASLQKDEAEAIVKAANCHADLVAALERVTALMDVCASAPGLSVWEAAKEARAALAKAKGAQ